MLRSSATILVATTVGSSNVTGLAEGAKLWACLPSSPKKPTFSPLVPRVLMNLLLIGPGSWNIARSSSSGELALNCMLLASSGNVTLGSTV